MAVEPGFVEPLSYPVWVTIDADQLSAGVTFATHYLTALDGSGDKELPIFRTEAHADRFVAAKREVKLEKSSVDDAGDMAILLELFKARGGSYVRLDPQVGPDGEILGGDFAPALDPFIGFVKSNG